MNEVPLIEKVQKNDINTTIIAIKKQLKELNALLGLIDIQSDKQDLSPYVRKDEVIDEVKRFDLSPVTSNAVSKAISYSTSEIKTGGYWIDGKPIYRKAIQWYINGQLNPDLTYTNHVLYGALPTDYKDIIDCRMINHGTESSGTYWSIETISRMDTYRITIYEKAPAGIYADLGYVVLDGWVIVEYTKTTD